MHVAQRSSVARRILATNAALFALIAALAALLVTSTYEVPAPPPMELIDRRLDEVPAQVQPASNPADRFQSFGNVDLFVPLIKPPPPPPPPVLPPPPDPSLADAIRSWQIKGISAGYVFLEDPRARKEWVMDIQDASTLTETIRFNNADMVIKLESIDEIDSTAVFSYTGRQGKQEVTRGVFED